MGLKAGHESQFTLSSLPPWKKDELVNIIYCEVGRIQRTALLDYELLQSRDHEFSFVSTQCLDGRKCDKNFLKGLKETEKPKE